MQNVVQSVCNPHITSRHINLGLCVVLSVVALGTALACGCRDDNSAREPAGTRTPPAAEGPRSEAQTPPLEEESARGETNGIEAPILWLSESAGYTPVDVAELYRKHPYRFALYADGTAIWRNDRFEHRKAKLSAVERDELLDRVADAGFLTIAPAALDAATYGMAILDAGRESIGLRTKGDVREIHTIAGNFLLQQHREEPSIQAYFRVRQILVEFDHRLAEAYEVR